MKLGLYTFATLAYIALIGGYVYTLDLGKYRLEMLNVELPIALWIVFPLLLLFLFTVGHMLFYGLKNYFQIKKWKKDIKKVEDALYWSLIHEPREQKYMIDEIRESAVLLGKSLLNTTDDIEGLTPRLSRVVHLIQKVNNGEYVDFKEHKMLKAFKSGNPILIKNRLNRLESDEKFVEEVMRSTSEYSEAVQAEALRIFAKNKDFVAARKYAKVFDTNNFLVMLNRIDDENDLGLTSEILNDFVSALHMKCEDYIKIAEITKKHFKPEENLQLFREYQVKDEKAQNAYLYLLFEYELLDQVANYLDEQGESEFMKFRALYTLKRANSKYKLEDIIDISTVCKKVRF